jgi:hypothetical protein
MHYCNICNFLTSTNHNLQNHYKSKKHILQQNIFNNINNICAFCNRSYKYQNSFHKHQQICKKNTINIVNNIDNNISEIDSLKIAINQINKDLEIVKLKNELKDKTITIKELENKNLQLQINNNVINTTVINNNINNNIKISKIEFLNTNFRNVIDINTFTNNYKNEYGLTKEQTAILLENYKSIDINRCINSIVFYLKTSAIKQYKYLYNIDIKMSDIILPFILTDSALRSHFEKTTNGNWDRIIMMDNINHIINITNDHIFKHHKEYMAFNGFEKKRLINGILKESGYENLTTITIPDFYKQNNNSDENENDKCVLLDYETENENETENEIEIETKIEN